MIFFFKFAIRFALLLQFFFTGTRQYFVILRGLTTYPTVTPAEAYFFLKKPFSTSARRNCGARTACGSSPPCGSSPAEQGERRNVAELVLPPSGEDSASRREIRGKATAHRPCFVGGGKK